MTADGARPGLILAIDAAPGVGSVALIRDGAMLVASVVAMRPATPDLQRTGDDDPLMLAVARVLCDAGCTATELEGVACGAGPGAFTSLRIAAAIAKGIAHACGCALLAGPSLGWAAAARAPSPGTWLVTLDALRGERYAARVELAARASDLVDPRPYTVVGYTYLGVYPVAELNTLVTSHHATGRLDIDADLTAPPSAASAAATRLVRVDLASWEPSYGRLAEAQVRWEADHGPLPTTPGVVSV